MPAVLGAEEAALDAQRRLEEAGYIKVTKGFADRKPRTEYRLTAKGRRALETYLQQMESILSATRHALERQ